MDDILTIRSVFTQRVLATRSDGSADIELPIEKLEVSLGKRSFDALNRLPLEGRVLPAKVDSKGHMILHRLVTVYLNEGRVYLGMRNFAAQPKGSSGPAEARESRHRARIDMFASFDPRTGRLSGSASLTDKSALAAVEVHEEDPAVDAVPRRLFDMLEFPESARPRDGVLEVRRPVRTARWRLASLEGSLATLRVTSTASGGDAKAAPVLAGVPATPLRLADLTVRFDTVAGALIEVRGTIATKTSMKINSRLLLTRLRSDLESRRLPR